MANSLAKAPFLRFLLPLVAGILLQYNFDLSNQSIPLLFLGIAVMLLSYFISPPKQHKWRWAFGIGLFIFLIATGVIGTSICQNKSFFDFPDESKSYKGIITDIPLQKPKSIACKVQLENTDKKIVCYLQKGVRSSKVEVGDEIMFHAQVEQFKHFGNPDNFDYPSYMHNKGFAGSVYLFSDDWEASGKKTSSLTIEALKCRQAILNIFGSLQLNETEYSILAALILGYQDALTDDLQQSFRTTGTAHILSVSGMHVGIIYGIIVSIFSLFFGQQVRRNKLVQCMIIICLWIYAFITGLPPSVIRATIMLTIFCIANICGRRGFSYNSISAAAFLMLLYNPFYLFDLGFQLSYAAVLSICFLQPILSRSLYVKNKYMKYGWNLFTLSVAAQIGTFPICLYYFGTFPTYFFATNLLIIPLVSIIVYLGIILFPIALIVQILPESYSSTIYYVPIHLLKGVIHAMVESTRFFEQLPYALIENIKTSLPTTILLMLIILFTVFFGIHKKAQSIIYILCFTLMGVIIHAIPPQNTLNIYNENGKSEICWNIGHDKFKADSVKDYILIPLGDKKLLSVGSDCWKNKLVNNKLDIDYLHIVKNDTISLYSLTRVFNIKHTILDHSLSNNNKKKLIKECKNIGIPYYDVSEKGFFRIKF